MNIGKILADKVNSKQQCLPEVHNLTTFEDVKKWFRTLPLEDDKLELEDGYYLDLESIEELIEEEEVEIYNNSMCERGDDYCTIKLEEFKFEFSWENEK